MAQTIHIIKGNGKTLNFTLKNCDGSDYDVTDVTSVVFLAKERLEEDDASAVISQTITTPSSNIISIALTSTQTLAVEAGTYYAGLKVYRTNDMDEQVWSGELIVERGTFSD